VAARKVTRERSAMSEPSTPANHVSPLILKTTRLRSDPEFMWVTGGRPYSADSEGNGQPQRDGTWGLWYSPARPLQKSSRATRTL
jgi:hypothetical protein